jgi:hypothetical protein
VAIAALIPLLPPLPILVLLLPLETHTLFLPARVRAFLLLPGTLLLSPAHLVPSPLTGDSHHLTHQLPQY